MDLTKSIVFPADQVDIHLLRCQQLRLYILKAARALLSHQDKLRQILSQAAVVDIGPNPSGKMLVSEPSELVRRVFMENYYFLLQFRAVELQFIFLFFF